MSQPLVCCVMLVNGRPEMVRRAVESFRAQGYEPKHLLIYDTSEDRMRPDLCDSVDVDEDNITVRESNAINHHGARKSMGYLRNRAAMNVSEDADIIAHWDSDDWSHPNRLTEQVALLESSGADAVGYDEMLFWDQRSPRGRESGASPKGCDMASHAPESWLYSQHLPGVHAVAVGTSLLYWRRTWQQKPFRDTSSGEDLHFCSGLRVATASSLHADGEPRMIASIHGGNTASTIDPKAREWKRAPEFDDYCRERMRIDQVVAC